MDLLENGINLDSIIDNTTGTATVISEEHDVNKINVDVSASAVNSAIRQRLGLWDAAEMGISLAEVEARIAFASTEEEKAKILLELIQRGVRRANLDTSNGRVNFMSAGALPWHALGVRIDKACKSDQAWELSGQNFPVAKVPVLYKDANGNIHESTELYIIVRTDTNAVLSEKSVGRLYTPIQNKEAFDFLDTVLEEFGARYETAGSIYGGKQVFMTLHMPNYAFKVNGVDAVDPYIVFMQPHDCVSGTAQGFPSMLRAECANTVRIAMAQRKSKGFAIRHMGKWNNVDKIREARKALGISVKGFETFKESAQHLATVNVEPMPYFNSVLDEVAELVPSYGLATAEESAIGAVAMAHIVAKESGSDETPILDSLVKECSRKIEKRENWLTDICNRHESQKNGVAGMRGTGWGVLNAITERMDWGKNGKEAKDLTLRATRRLEDVLAGDADDVKQIAYKQAMAYAN